MSDWDEAGVCVVSEGGCVKRPPRPQIGESESARPRTRKDRLLNEQTQAQAELLGWKQQQQLDEQAVQYYSVVQTIYYFKNESSGPIKNSPFLLIFPSSFCVGGRFCAKKSGKNGKWLLEKVEQAKVQDTFPSCINLWINILCGQKWVMFYS